MIAPAEVALILKGWGESAAPLRVILTGPDLIFSAFCTVRAAREESVVFEFGADNVMEVFLTGCLAEFGDAPSGMEGLPIGGKVESVIVCVRGDFRLVISLLSHP